MKKLGSLAAIAVAVGLAGSVSAQPAGQTNYQWSAAGDGTTWSQSSNWFQGVVPPTDGTTFQIDTYAVNQSMIPITISPSDLVQINDAIFGPMWGQTLNINGTVHCGFGEFIWGDLNGAVTTIVSSDIDTSRPKASPAPVLEALR